MAYPVPGEWPPIKDPAPPKPDRKIDLLEAGLGKPVPLAYGPHLVAGSILFEQKSGTDTLIYSALGEGEWDSIEALWVNGISIDATDTAIVHFHPGLDGESAIESSPGTRNQKFCSFLPAGFRPQLTFARTAYLALKLAADKNAPAANFHILGIFKCLRVRLFDQAGAQTSYAYSANPAWIALDYWLRRVVKRNGRINEALSSAEKARIDFPAFKAWADACDADIGGGVKRWEAGVVISKDGSMMEALNQMVLLGRGYLLLRNGKLAGFHDEARAALLSLGQGDLWADSLQLARRSLRGAPNRLQLTFRDLDSGLGPGTLSSTGTAVTGTDSDFSFRFKKDSLVQLRSGAQSRQLRAVASDPASATALTLAAAFSSDQSGVQYGNPGLDFQPRDRQLDDEDLQARSGRPIAVTFDLGNNIPSRVERLALYWLGRAARNKMASARIPWGVAGAHDLLPGDVVTAPAALDYLTTRDYEIETMRIFPELEVEFEGDQYDSAIFTDLAGPQQAAAPTLAANLKFSPILGDETYDTSPYHKSAFRRKVTTLQGGTTTVENSWITVGSFELHIAPGQRSFHGTLQVERTSGGTVWQIKGRIQVGAQNSAEVTLDDPDTTTQADVSLTGLTPDSDITVNVQAFIATFSDGVTARVRFHEVEGNPQDASLL